MYVGHSIDSIHKYFAEKNIDYDTPQERQDLLKTYFNEAYPDLFDLPEAKSDTLGQIKKGSSLRINPEKEGSKKYRYSGVLNSDYTPAVAYIDVSQQLFDRNEPDKSYEVLKLGARRIGRHYRFLPGLIRSAKAFGNPQLAEDFTFQCAKEDDSYLTKLGDIFRPDSEKKNESPYYQECVAILGYDPAIKRQSEIAKQKELNRKPLQESPLGDVLKNIEIFNKR